MATRADDSHDRVGYIFHSVAKSDLKPGDHIYCHRMLYNHHGIYIGEHGCEVIHFSGPDNKGSLDKKRGSYDDQTRKEVTKLSNELKYLPEDSERAKEVRKRLNELHKDHQRPVCIQSTDLDTFCDGAKIRLVSYNCSGIKKLLVITRGSCHTMEAMPPSETVKLAKHFLNNPNEWGNYKLKSNNCETFACFCKTGQMEIAAQLNPTRNVVQEAFITPCQTYERALRDYRALQ